jgi:hypothetical protein
MNEIINVLNESEFSFIKGGLDVYFIEKDRHNVLFPLIAISKDLLDEFLKSPYKTIVRDTEGEIIMKNFDVGGGDTVEKKTLTQDLTTVHELLSEVEATYNSKQKLLEDIDKALVEGNKELFIELTNQLREVS